MRPHAPRSLTPARPAVPLTAMALLLACHPLSAQQGNPPAQAAPADASGDAAFLSNAPSVPAPSPETVPPATSAPAADSPQPAASPVTPADSLTPPPEPSPSPTPTADTPAPKTPGTADVSRSEIRDISVQGPDAESPFFVERQEARQALAREAREGFGMYVPKPPHPPVGKQVRKFLNGLIGRGADGKSQGAAPITVTVDPSDFSLASTGEIEVTLRLTNQRRHEIELLYPDNQRIEILVKDPAGVVVSKWSQDRAFEHTEGYVEVNPKEFICYTERLPTAGMKAGVPYTLEVSIANQTGYTVTSRVTPKP